MNSSVIACAAVMNSPSQSVTAFPMGIRITPTTHHKIKATTTAEGYSRATTLAGLASGDAAGSGLCCDIAQAHFLAVIEIMFPVQGFLAFQYTRMQREHAVNSGQLYSR